jgi:hypothetical protein
MSSTITNEMGQMSVVIGRGYGDEPIRLIPLSDWGTAVEVRREGDRDSIGFKKGSVYRFDRELFDGLCAAFNSGDKKTLTRLWNSAQHYD